MTSWLRWSISGYHRQIHVRFAYPWQSDGQRHGHLSARGTDAGLVRTRLNAWKVAKRKREKSRLAFGKMYAHIGKALRKA